MITFKRILRAVALLTALFGTLSRIGFSFAHGSGWNVLFYFTIQSNLFVCAFLFVEVLSFIRSQGKREHFFSPAVHSAVMLYIAITGIIFNTMLLPLIDFEGFNFLLSTINHTVTPLLFLLDWFFNRKRVSIKKTTPFKWLIYPACYAVFGTIEGSITGKFRYFFLDYPALGVPKYPIMLAVVTAVFLLTGFGLYSLHQLGLKGKEKVSVKEI